MGGPQPHVHRPSSLARVNRRWLTSGSAESACQLRRRMVEAMEVTISLPEDISAALKEQWDNVPRRSLEAIAVEAYRTGALTESQVRRLLGFETRFQVHALLKEHQMPLRYTAADLEDDLAVHREFGILPSR